MLVIFALACTRASSTGNVIAVSNDNQKASNNFSPTPTTDVKVQTAKCPETEGYCLEVVEDAEREAKNVNIIVGDKTKAVVKLPSPLDQNGYALNWAKKTDSGFEISIEYGSRIYFDKTFVFLKKNEDFHLTEIKVESFDKRETEKVTKKTVKINPPVSVEKFNIEDYMND